MNKIDNAFRRAVALSALSLLLFIAHAAAQTSIPSPELVARADQYVNDLVRENKFSGSILVARDGKVIFSKGYGMASLEYDVPNTPQTKFRLGSITKQFTAAAIMLLQERGQLSVQDPVCKHVEPCPAAWKPLAIHHLLTHTSGIPNFTNAPDYRKTMRLPTTIAESITRFRDRPLDFAPGERFSYSNSGYILLGHIIEKVSGKTYEDFMRENVFEPLGMRNTGYDSPAKVLKNRAAGYALVGNELVNAAYIDMTIPHAAGALYSTTEDLYLWDRALYEGRLIPQKSLDVMLTPAKDGYAYGLGVGKQFTLRRISHGGGIEGFNTFMARFPEANATIIVLSNIERGDTYQVAARLMRMFLADKIVLPAVAKVEPAVLQSYVGRYEVDPAAMPNFVFDISVENGELFIKPSHVERHKLAPLSAAEFFDFDDVDDARYTFQRDDKGNVTGVRVVGIGPQPFNARRLTLPAPSLKGNTTFRLRGFQGARVVALAGSFNNWNQSQTLCAREGGEWLCRVDLVPGKHTYKFVVDGNWMTDPSNPKWEDDGFGNINSVLVKTN